MNYSEKFIRTFGNKCIIRRLPSVISFVSIKPATQSFSDNRALYREGLALATSNLSAGEIIEVDEETLLIRSVYKDKQSGQLSFIASKVNAVLTHTRFKEVVDEWSNVKQEWVVITENVYSTAQIVSAALRQQDPGLLATTKWIFFVSADMDLMELDRFQFKPNGEKCRVDSIDDIRLSGLLRVQCSDDRR